MLTDDEVLALIGGQEAVRAYLRGIEEGSEADLDAQDAMRAAIAEMRLAGVRNCMAEYEPKLYGRVALMRAQLLTESEPEDMDKLEARIGSRTLLLRCDPRNKEEVTDNEDTL